MCEREIRMREIDMQERKKQIRIKSVCTKCGRPFEPVPKEKGDYKIR